MADFRRKLVFLLSCVMITVYGAGARAASADVRRLVPLGTAAGIRLRTEGVLVVGLGGVQSGEETLWPARDAGVREGDLILSVDGRRVRSAEELQTAMEQGSGVLTLELRRGGGTLTAEVSPVTGMNGEKRMGIWIRDSVMGIGTLTFYDPGTGMYGALGHGIGGTGAADLLPIGGGELLEAEIVGVRRGGAGVPGELRGSFDMEKRIGSVQANTDAGIFGFLDRRPEDVETAAAPSGTARLGKAGILACVDGEAPRLYDIRICALYHSAGTSYRDMLIEVTDPALLEKTGGIVQGMSGSPILQDGALVGAVTHVLVNDPAKGYGIRIDSMLSASDAALRDSGGAPADDAAA